MTDILVYDEKEIPIKDASVDKNQHNLGEIKGWELKQLSLSRNWYAGCLRVFKQTQIFLTK